jgi:hypothetical protein
MTLFAFETIEESRQRKLFTLLEVDFLSTHRFWLNIPLMAIAGIAVAVIFSLTDQGWLSGVGGSRLRAADYVEQLL